VVSYTYDPWGEILSVTGTLATTIGQLNPIRYRGYYYDNETGYYYCHTRYYNPEICRWINPDSFMSTGQGILGNNMYAYCGNNPVMNIDKRGYLFESAANGVSGGLLVEPYIIFLDNGYIETYAQYSSFIGLCIAYGKNDDEDNDDLLYLFNKIKPNMTPRKAKRHGSENRQKTGDRERNVAHPNGEEHSRVPKGNRGIKKSEAIVGLFAASATLVWLVGNDLFGVGVADDHAIIPTASLWLKYIVETFS